MSSRVARKPITLPKGVEVKIENQNITVKGPKGSLSRVAPASVEVKIDNNIVSFAARKDDKTNNALAGTERALLNNMVEGVSNGFQQELVLVGVGYKAQMKGSALGLALGFSHPVEHAIPKGITIETPTQTEIIIKGIDKQLVGQVAADIIAYRPPEPYKGKGIRKRNKPVKIKEVKKK